MKQLIPTVAAVMLMAVSAYGQTPVTQSSPPPCTLNASQAPVVRGIRLGMKVEDVLAIFPGSAEKDEIKSALEKANSYPNFGMANLSFPIRQYPTTKSRFEGIADYQFASLDGRIVQYVVEYDGMPYGPAWRRIDDFIGKMSEAFHLPPATDWIVDPNVWYRKSLKCDGFRLQAAIPNPNGSFTVSTPDPPYKAQQDRRTALEEKLKREFKP